MVCVGAMWLVRFKAALVRHIGGRRSAGRLNFPLISRDEGPKVEITNADIDVVFEAEEVERHRQ